MTETVPSWSDERVDLLRRLWQEGLSASRIATQLGGVTRNAVIGKIHRLGLSGRVTKGAEGDTPRKPAREVEAPTGPETAAGAASDSPATETTGTVIPMQSPSQASAPEVPATPASVARMEPVSLAVSSRVTIMDLRESMCRWPLGDPTSPDFHYCGDRAITGLPYCPQHAQIAYQPAAERKRDRRVGGFR
ncbi:hypothetical protein PMNALOAF_4193 [Methylobacterium adhaesivum]|uniref:GcrA family cell cycle regulator n=1 Tax=Methylobacterium adhaesivum TaxID=333297 RepID=A0ABT8BCC0_9HYPH|nr:GcrA family cell cycle regulator [Methylobacterium adhaesivum]MDN3589697.1 GcrA family cell cycle regulator [Methylobacterium adhaesivum]GJD32913.1 hypothetical protein PMNALOAF_4193 [Methylobacterium adhaesivum]